MIPIAATLYHYDNAIAPLFVALTPHKTRHYFVEPMALGCNSDLLQAKDRVLSGALITTGAWASTSVALTSIVGTKSVDWG